MKRNFILLLLIFAASALTAQNFVSGTILYHNNPEYPIPDVQVDLYDSDGDFVAGTVTNNEGVYTFENLPDGTYQVDLSTDLPGGDITMNDALSILFYLNGLIEYTPIQEIAMDVNASGMVGFNDFMYILIQHFLFNQPFPAGDWVFETTTITTGQRDGGTLAGSRTGDAEGALVPTGREIVMQNVLTATENIAVLTEDEILIPIYASTEFVSMDAYGLVLNYDPKVVSIISVTPYEADANYHVASNELRMSWVGLNEQKSDNPTGKIADIRIALLGNGQIEREFPFEVASMSHVVVNGDLKQANYSMPTISRDNIFCSELYPNPASDYTQININLSSSTNLEYKIISSNGQLVKLGSNSFSSGLGTLRINTAELTSGVYQFILMDTQTNTILAKKRFLVQ